MNTNFVKKTDALERLLVDFYTLTNMKICIYDGDGKEVSFFPERLSAFCGSYREDERIDKKCRECDKNAIERCRKTGRAHIYTCHAGLTECITPIVIGSNVRGFIAIGQIRGEKATRFSGVGIEPEKLDKLTDEYDKLPVMTDAKIEAAAHVLEACASYEELKQFMNDFESSIEIRIEDWVGKNLQGNVGVENLCENFHFSRKELYSVVKRSFNTTPAEYVKNKRLERACLLLRSTRHSISKIAEECGIGDYNYFSKLFKRKYKVAPREYRKQNTK
ncbi:MAG: PocR ligand-binding domain-containing protein [Clostridia bacterium]|nr:PocR ligand-binding domain-containing protein [Clostridia bacterium]